MESKLSASMDRAAEEAAREIESIDKGAVKAVAEWWARHYMSAGHKRLGRILLGYAQPSIVDELREALGEPEKIQ